MTNFQGHKFHKFDIFYKGVAIGIVNVGTTAPPETCLQIINSNVIRHIIVRSFRIGQFAVSSNYTNKDLVTSNRHRKDTENHNVQQKSDKNSIGFHKISLGGLFPSCCCFHFV